jgi:hypothetical protein
VVYTDAAFIRFLFEIRFLHPIFSGNYTKLCPLIASRFVWMGIRKTIGSFNGRMGVLRQL